jgi:hypothetical protein
MLKYHYVYRITNLIKNKHYYGVRSTKFEPINDLGIKYFSSSKNAAFIKEQKQNPENFKDKIVSIYSSRKEALNKEIVLHAKFDVGVNESFYNKSKQTSTGFDRSGITYSHSEETKLKIGLGNKNKIVSVETRQKLSKLHKGKMISEKHRKQISDKMAGKTFTKDHKLKISKSLLGVIKPSYICTHCGKEGKSGVMFRWHFDNCSSIH